MRPLVVGVESRRLRRLRDDVQVTAEQTRVVVADDSLLIRQGLVGLIDSSPEMQVVGQCNDVAELDDALASSEVHVVITDIRMPPTHTTEGLDAALRIRVDRPDVGVIVLSQFSEPEYVSLLFRDGSDRLGYLLKERVGDVEQLEHAVRSVRAGGSAVDPKIIDLMVQGERRRSGAGGVDSLTPRECDVLGLIAEGLNNQTVADRLVLSQKAVQKHINSIFSKLALSEDPESDRRVRAVLMWLSAR